MTATTSPYEEGTKHFPSFYSRESEKYPVESQVLSKFTTHYESPAAQYFQQVAFVTGLNSDDGLGILIKQNGTTELIPLSIQAATQFANGGRLELDGVTVEVVKNARQRVLQTQRAGWDDRLRCFVHNGIDFLRSYTALKIRTTSSGMVAWTDRELFRELIQGVLQIQPPKIKRPRLASRKVA